MTTSYTQEDIAIAAKQAEAIAKAEVATDCDPVGFHTSQFNGTPMSVTIAPFQWLIKQGRGLLINGEWVLLSSEDLDAHPGISSFGDEPLTFSIPTDTGAEWITFAQLKEGAMRAANERLQSLAPTCEECDWYIHHLVMSADPADSFYTIKQHDVEHKMPLV